MISLFSHLSGPDFYRSRQRKIRRDADRLITRWGSTAYDRATDLSAREDMGFLATPEPGHWWQVRNEIGLRTGRSDTFSALPMPAALPEAALTGATLPVARSVHAQA